MGPLPPLGPIRGTNPYESTLSGVPKTRGPQGQANRGDAGRKKKAFGNLPPIGGPQPQQQQPMALPEIPSVQPPLSITDKPATDHSMTVTGFLKNAAADISEFVAAPLMMAKVTWQAGLDIAKNIKYAGDLFDHPELMSRELDNTWRSVIQTIVEPYRDGIGQALYKHPFTVLLDATTVFDVLGAGLKVAGKVGVKASAKTGFEAVKALAQNPLWKLGDSIQSMPGRMFAKPFELAGKGLMKIPAAATAARKFGVTPVGFDTAKIIGAHKLHQRALVSLPVETLFKSKIPKQDWALFDDIVNGVTPVSKATPAMKDRVEFWRQWNQEFEHALTDLGIRETEALENAVLGQTAIKLEEKGLLKSPLHEIVEGNPRISKAAIDEAKAWREGANPFGEATNPVYRPWSHERSFNVAEFIDALQQGEGSGKYLQFSSRLERRTGAKPVVLDPDFWTARSAFQRSESLAAISAFHEVIGKYGKPLKGGKALQGHVIVPPIFKKYTGEGLVNAQDVLVQRMTEKLKLAEAVGEDRAKAIAAGIRETRDELLASAKELQEQVLDVVKDKGKGWAVQIPEDAAYVLQKSFLGPRGFWRFYDNMLDTWRDMLLTFMPRYYINNLLGNAILLTFGGHNPITKVAALKADDLPGEALGSMLAAEGGHAGSLLARPFERQQRPVRRFLNRMADLTDNQAKQVFAGQAAAEVIERAAMVENTAAQGLYLLDSIQKRVDVIAQARRKMLETPLEELRSTKRLFSGAEEAFQHRQKAIGAEIADLEQQLANAKPIYSGMGTPSNPEADLITRQIEARKQAMASISQEDVLLSQMGLQKAPKITLSPEHQGMADATLKEMMSIQHQIQTTRDLSRLDPTKGTKHLDLLVKQLEMKARHLESIDPNILIDRMPEFRKSPDMMALAETKLKQATLAPYAGMMEQAVREMENWFGNYGRLHPLEKNVIRRVIPFWTFSSTMFKLLYQLPFIRPKTSFLWNRFSKFMLEGIAHEDLPERLKYSIPIGGDENGWIMFINLRGINPLDAAAKVGSFGGVSIPKVIDPTQNPVIKMAVESMGGFDTFIEKPFVKRTDFVYLDGRVLRYDPDTRKIEQVIPQKPILRSLYDQIPYMKMVDEILVGTGLVDEGVSTSSGRNPDGTLNYHRHWLQGIARWMGTPTTIQNPERIRMQQQLMKRSMGKRFRSAAGRSDPDTRIQLERVLQDLETAEFDQ